MNIESAITEIETTLETLNENWETAHKTLLQEDIKDEQNVIGCILADIRRRTFNVVTKISLASADDEAVSDWEIAQELSDSLDNAAKLIGKINDDIIDIDQQFSLDDSE